MIRNERTKLFANFVSALGLGLIAIAVLRPALETGGDPLRIAFWAGAGLALHGRAQYIPGFVR
jgi:hypothetical protein